MKRTSKKHNILLPLFDIRPLGPDGELRFEYFERFERVVRLRGDYRPLIDPRAHRLQIRFREDGASVVSPPKDEVILGYDEFLETEGDSSFPSRLELLEELEKIEDEDQIRETKRKSVRMTTPHRPSHLLEARILENKVVPHPPLRRIPSLLLIFRHSLKAARWFRGSLWGFVGISLIVSLAFLIFVFTQSTHDIKNEGRKGRYRGYVSFESARETLIGFSSLVLENDLSLAQKRFLNREDSLGRPAAALLGFFDFLPFSSIFPSPTASGIEFEERVSRGGAFLSEGMGELEGISFSDFFPPKKSTSYPPTERYLRAKDAFTLALKELREASFIFREMDLKELSYETREGFLRFHENFFTFEEGIESFLNYSEVLLTFLGHDTPRSYLVLFQDPMELRPTGGSIGSYAVVKLDRGRVTKLRIDDIYVLDGKLREKVIPPQPIQALSTAWGIHDANWFFDFPTSAKKIAEFFEKAEGTRPDGVIAVTSDALVRPLDLTGPIEIPSGDHLVTKDSIVEDLGRKTDDTYDTELNQPKPILKDLIPLLIERMRETGSRRHGELAKTVLASLNQKDILLYSRDPRVEEFILEQGWGGSIVETPRDFLAVVHSNGNRTGADRFISERVIHSAEITEGGEIMNTLTIIRDYQGSKGVSRNKPNKDYLRVYVPLGSELLEASGYTVESYRPPIDYSKKGFTSDPLVRSVESSLRVDQKTGTHIFEESGKTVFGNWVTVKPRESVIVFYKYRLPFRLQSSKDTYSLYVGKQPGARADFKTTIILPGSFVPTWSYPPDLALENGKFTVHRPLESDLLLGFILGGT